MCKHYIIIVITTAADAEMIDFAFDVTVTVTVT